MLSFEVTAIDLILVITVIILIVLYWTKSSKSPENQILHGTTNDAKPQKNIPNPQNGYAECPRGFGYIKNIGDNGSIPERCLGCYRIMECYSEQEEIRPQFNPV